MSDSFKKKRSAVKSTSSDKIVSKKSSEEGEKKDTIQKIENIASEKTPISKGVKSLKPLKAQKQTFVAEKKSEKAKNPEPELPSIKHEIEELKLPKPAFEEPKLEKKDFPRIIGAITTSFTQLKNKRWLLLGLCLSLIFIISGISAIESYYAPTFPIEIQSYNISQDKYLNVTLFSCTSNKIYPVVGEDLNCCAYVEDIYKKDFKENIPNYIYFGDHNFDENYTESFRYLGLSMTRRKILENKEMDCRDIRITKYGRNTYTLGLMYHNAEYDNERTIFIKEITFFAYDLSEYDNKLNQKLSLYFIIISLGIFSMFSFVKTLLDIIRDK